jgi:hypothetical protein
MEIEASHEGARVLIAVTVRRPDMTFAEDAWSARIVFALEPGEQLAASHGTWHPYSISERARRARSNAASSSPMLLSLPSMPLRKAPAPAKRRSRKTGWGDGTWASRPTN